MKQRITILMVLLSICGIVRAQENNPDYIIKLNQDTIRCKIELKDSSYIYYKENQERKMIEVKEVLSIYQETKKQENKETKDGTSSLPRITLVSQVVTSSSYSTSGPGGLYLPHTTTTSSKVYVGFYLNSKTDSTIKFGWKDKNIIPFLAKDKEALKYHKKSVHLGTLSTITFAAVATSLAGIIIYADGDAPDSEMRATISAAVFIPSFITCWISSSAHTKMFRKSIKTYNKNAGYGEAY